MFVNSLCAQDHSARTHASDVRELTEHRNLLNCHSRRVDLRFRRASILVHYVSGKIVYEYSPPSLSLTSDRTLNHTFMIEPRFERTSLSLVRKRAVSPIALSLRLFGWPILSNYMY